MAKLAGTEEGVYLEFKKPSEFIHDNHFSRDEFARELTETVSAFLNSDGGVILIGVQTDEHERDKKIEYLKSPENWALTQTLEHLKIPLKASQIRDLIFGNIVPKPSGVEVKDLDIPFGKDKTTVFVVTVTASPFGAHQSVKTSRYYRRTADGDEPMLDFEIRAVNSRRSGPLLNMEFKVSHISDIPFEERWKDSSVEMIKGGSEEDSFFRANLIIAISNRGMGTADIARFDMGIPNPWFVKNYAADGTNSVGHWVPNSGLQYLIDRPSHGVLDCW
ncbi:helix-turn-helix domain-containing protein [Chloroflexota bacterium]